MTIRETLEKISDLNKEISSLQTDKVNPFVKERIVRYLQARALESPYLDYPKDIYSINTWTVENDFIIGDWEEFWAYGGHAEGSFNISINYIVNDGDLESFEKECQLKADQKKEQEKQDRIAAAKAELKRLTGQ